VKFSVSSWYLFFPYSPASTSAAVRRTTGTCQPRRQPTLTPVPFKACPARARTVS
jgi:hypothetical protein